MLEAGARCSGPCTRLRYGVFSIATRSFVFPWLTLAPLADIAVTLVIGLLVTEMWKVMNFGVGNLRDLSHCVREFYIR